MKEEAGRTVFITPKKHEHINLRSEMAQEIIFDKPDFIETWALPIFISILILLLAATWFVKYPDVIEAPVVLTSSNAPKDIVPRQDGRLTRVFFHNNDKVKKGDVIGWIESTAGPQEVITLSKEIDQIVNGVSSGQTHQVSDVFQKRYNQLGEIQQTYQEFITAWQLFNDYTVNGFYSRKKRLLDNDIRNIDKTNQTLQTQKQLLLQDIGLAKESFKMNEILSNEKVLTKEEYRTQKSKFVNKQMALPQLEATILSNESQKMIKEKDIDQLEHDISQQKTLFQQSLLSLKSAVDDWKKKYLLQAPVEGNLFFIVPIQENQYLQAGKLIGYINPNDSHFYAEAVLPQSNFGKIDTGLKVQLQFDAYPYQEAGFIEGTIDYISKIPSDSGFLATVRLDHGLTTNTRKIIPYKNRLKGRAIVITKNMRLLNRIYYSVVKSTSVGNR